MEVFFLAALGVIVALPAIFLACAALSYKPLRRRSMVAR